MERKGFKKKRRDKIIYSKKKEQPVMEEMKADDVKKSMQNVYNFEIQFSASELAPITSALLAELADSQEETKFAHEELAKIIYGIIHRLSKLKQPLADTIFQILSPSRSTAILSCLTDLHLDHTLVTIADTIKAKKLREERIGCLRLLSHLIFAHPKIEGYLKRIFPIVLERCDPALEDTKILREAFNCLGNILFKFPDSAKLKSEELLAITVKAFTHTMASFKPEIPSQNKEIRTIIRSLSYCLSYPKVLSTDYLDKNLLFFSIYRLLFFGTPFANYQIPGIKKAEISEGEKTVHISSTSSSSSGSEISDPEDVEGETPHDTFGKIRTHALICLQHFCRLNDKYIFDKWQSILPRFLFTAPLCFSGKIVEDASFWNIEEERILKWERSAQEMSFLALLHQTKDLKVKAAVINTLNAIIDHSPIRQWQGTLGTNTTKKKAVVHSFTSLSEVIGNVIVSLHYLLINYLKSESDSSLQTSLLKSLSSLLNCTQYLKMPPGLVTYTLLESVVKLLKQTPAVYELFLKFYKN